MKLRENFGDATDLFITGLDGLLEKYSHLWRLSGVQYMETVSVNLLFTCSSDLYGSCVLKAGVPNPEVATEVHSLLDNACGKYCKIWDYNISDGVLLLERIMPGATLKAVQDCNERAGIMAGIMKGLHSPYHGMHAYPTYGVWYDKLCVFFETSGRREIFEYVKAGRAIYRELRLSYHNDCLLHGDLHHENVLLNQNGGYTIVDPKGVIGDPIMETARFLLNEVETNGFGRIAGMISIMGEILEYPEKDIKLALAADCMLSCGWSADENCDDRRAAAIMPGLIRTCGNVYQFGKGAPDGLHLNA